MSSASPGEPRSARAISGRHLGNEAQGIVRIDLRPQDRLEALDRPAWIWAALQDLASVLAEEPGTRLLEVEGVCREGVTFLLLREPP